MNQSLFFFVSLLGFFFVFLATCPVSTAQAPAQAPAVPADAPGPPPPTNVTKILEKAGQFTVLMRLLKNTQVGDQITTQLNNSNQGLTIFAPTDNAFASLKSGTLNSLTDEEKVELLQFHLVPTYLSLSNFQTLSNPVRTQAGGDYEYPLNITTSGSSVNMSTGLVNTSVSGTIYTDGQLAVYQVDSVLQPIGIFKPRPPPPAPAPVKSKEKAKPASDSPNSEAKNISGAVTIDCRNWVVYTIVVVSGIASIFL